MTDKKQESLVRLAYEQAVVAFERGDDPYGCVLADYDGNLLEQDGNRENTRQDPTAHAEIVVIRKTCEKLRTNDLSAYVMACNYRPCPMCAAAISLVGIKMLLVGSSAPSCEELFAKHAEKSLGVRVIGGLLNELCTTQVHEARKHKAMMNMKKND